MPIEIDPSRRLALRLHALHKSDRAWIISRLDAQVRGRLEPLLQELDDLGFRLDAGALDLLAECSLGESAHDSDDLEHVRILDQAPADWIARQFKDESKAVLACLTALHPWSWQSAMHCAGMEESPESNLEPCLGPTVRVRQVLLAHLVKRLQNDLPALTRPASLQAPAGQSKSKNNSPSGIHKWFPWKR